jgi:hypothetical protein
LKQGFPAGQNNPGLPRDGVRNDGYRRAVTPKFVEYLLCGVRFPVEEGGVTPASAGDALCSTVLATVPEIAAGVPAWIPSPWIDEKISLTM